MTWLVTGGPATSAPTWCGRSGQAGSGAVVWTTCPAGTARSCPRTCRSSRARILDTDLLAATLREHGSAAWSTWPASSTPACRSTGRCTPTTRTSPAPSACSGDAGAGVDKMVFSSSAAIYGTPDVDTVTERTATAPESPYGESKLVGEWLLRDQGSPRAAAHVAALLQRRGVGQHRPLRHQPAQPVPAGDRGPRRRVAPRGSTATTTRRPTAPASATTSTSPTSPTRTSPRRRRWPPGRRWSRSTTSAAATASRCGEIMDGDGPGHRHRLRARDPPARPGDPARIVASGELAARDLDWRMRHTVEDMVASAWQARQAHA